MCVRLPTKGTTSKNVNMIILDNVIYLYELYRIIKSVVFCVFKTTKGLIYLRAQK